MTATLVRALGLSGTVTAEEDEDAATDAAAGEDALIEMPIEEVVAIPMPARQAKLRSTRRPAKQGEASGPAEPVQPQDIAPAKPAAEEPPQPAKRFRWIRARAG